MSKSTTSTNFVHCDNVYGVPAAYIYMQNIGQHRLQVEMREVFNDKYDIDPGGCQDHLVSPYSEIWFRSLNGEEVKIRWGWNRCNQAPLPFSDAPEPEFSNNDHLISDEIKEAIKLKIEAGRNKIANRDRASSD